MRTPKFFNNTDDVLIDRLATKQRHRNILQSKIEVYDKDIRELQNELHKRGMKNQKPTT